MDIKSSRFWSPIAVALCLCYPLHAYSAQYPPSKSQAFAIAAMKDDTATMQRLLQAGVNLNAPVDRGETPLFFAIAYQRSKAVTFLLAHGADVNCKDNEGKTPLHWAVGTSLSLMELLVSKGANVNAADRSGETPLFQAILQSPSRALYLIEHGAEVNRKNNKCETPLHWAASGVRMLASEHKELVNKLLAAGADVNAVDQEGRTPLDCTFGADVNTVDRERQTPLNPTLAALDIRALLKAHGAVPVKHEPATLTSSVLITTLPPSPTPIVLTTRLRRAVETEDIYAVQALLAKGADVNAHDVDDSSPLSVALRLNYGSVLLTPPVPAILDALLGKGVNVNDRDKGGQTLLMRAVGDGQAPALDWLLAHGADVKVRDKWRGATALYYADDPRSIQTLVARGADINAQDAEGNTALMRRAMDGKPEAVRVLLAAHARPNIKNKEGWTAMTMVRANNSGGKNVRSVIRLLKQAGAK